MRKTLGILIVATLFLAWSGVAQSGGDDEARAVITKAIKAAGGEKALQKHRAATWTETGTYYGMGKGLPFTGKYSVVVPDKFRMEIEGIFTLVFNGDKGWISAGGETKEMDEQQFSAQKNDHRAGYINTVLPLKDKAFTLTMLPEAKVDDKPAVGVKVTRKGYPEVKLYFDKQSSLLVKSEWPSKAAEMKYKDVTATMYFSKFKEIDGAQVPTHLVLKRDGELFVEADVTEMKAVGKLDDSVFAKP
jgi:hypothetical protein